MKATVIIFTTIFLLHFSAKAETRFSSGLFPTDIYPSEMKSDIEQSVNNGNIAQLEKLAEDLESELTGSNEIDDYVRYYLAYINYRLFTEFTSDQISDHSNRLDQAITELETVIETDPQFTEAYALLANCYGLKATGLFKTMKYGPRFSRLIAKALELNAENPRALFIDAIGILKKPAVFGGNTDDAIHRFNEAIEAFKNWETPSEWAPEWGLADTYAWLGYAWLESDQPEKARGALEHALSIRHEFKWVNEELMPRLDMHTNNN